MTRKQGGSMKQLTLWDMTEAVNASGPRETPPPRKKLILTADVGRARWSIQTIQVIAPDDPDRDIEGALINALDLDNVEFGSEEDYDPDTDEPTHDVLADGTVVTLPDGEHFERNWCE